jgi:hypothetical protein
MAVTDISIANMALSRIGHHNEVTVLADSGSEAQRQCYLHYEPARDALLRAHPWNFAVKRTKLITQAEAAKTITGATQANPVVLTVASHGYSDGDRVRVASVGGMTQINNREFTIDYLTANTFSLLDENGTSYTAYTSGGTVTKIPAFGFSYWFTLPTDCLRVLRVADDIYEYKIENGRLLYNSSTAELHYIQKVTDPTVFDSLFVECLTVALAIRVAQKLSDNANLKESLKADLRDMMPDARTTDAQEGGTPDGLYAEGWVQSRY